MRIHCILHISWRDWLERDLRITLIYNRFARWPFICNSIMVARLIHRWLLNLWQKIRVVYNFIGCLQSWWNCLVHILWLSLIRRFIPYRRTWFLPLLLTSLIWSFVDQRLRRLELLKSHHRWVRSRSFEFICTRGKPISHPLKNFISRPLLNWFLLTVFIRQISIDNSHLFNDLFWFLIHGDFIFLKRLPQQKFFFYLEFVYILRSFVIP